MRSIPLAKYLSQAALRSSHQIPKRNQICKDALIIFSLSKFSFSHSEETSLDTLWYPLELKLISLSAAVVQDIILSNKNTVNLWCVSDNLLRGAALNAVEIAEAYVKSK